MDNFLPKRLKCWFLYLVLHANYFTLIMFCTLDEIILIWTDSENWDNNDEALDPMAYLEVSESSHVEHSPISAAPPNP